MAWEARWGLKQYDVSKRHVASPSLNGVGGPLGIETISRQAVARVNKCLNGVGGPLGIETELPWPSSSGNACLNGVGGPLGIETFNSEYINSEEERV